MAKLDQYRAKRGAGRTPEPMPGRRSRRTRPPSRAPSFVIQEHHARSLHWDFRLERDGVLVSWALPKGVPPDPRTNHLAVHTEDHPLEYADFHGEIPRGEYGAGSVSIWDRGTYEAEKWTDREVKVLLHGDRVSGRYVLFQTGRGNQWMIHRMDPAPSDWEPLPSDLRPMLAVPGELPTGSSWAYEMKWDGVRALMAVDGGRIEIRSRLGNEITGSYPELRGIGEELGARQLLLDGEIVALDERNRPSFSLLQQRMHVADPSQAKRLAQRLPVTFLAFDLLHLDGHSKIGSPYDERRQLLDSLGLDGAHWATPPSFPGPGADVMAAATQTGLEGVVAKRRREPYRPGRRSDAWIKVKAFRTQEVVVAGWTPGQGRRRDSIGALLLGLPDGEGGLHYVGKVGTGFTDVMLADLRDDLGRRERAESPFSGNVPRAQVAGATWVEPSLVGEVRFSEWTRDGRLRQPSWRGLRPDKRAEEVRPES
jgi:bifunctional non-homologous end joining protein LigD